MRCLFNLIPDRKRKIKHTPHENCFCAISSVHIEQGMDGFDQHIRHFRTCLVVPRRAQWRYLDHAGPPPPSPPRLRGAQPVTAAAPSGDESARRRRERHREPAGLARALRRLPRAARAVRTLGDKSSQPIRQVPKSRLEDARLYLLDRSSHVDAEVARWESEGESPQDSRV